MGTVILEPGNPYDFDLSDLNVLAEEVHIATGEHVEIAMRPERGYGVSLHEVLHVWIPWRGVEGAVASQLVAFLVGRLKSRWKRDEAQHSGQARPRSLLIWQTDGTCATVLVVDYGDEGEPIVREEGSSDRGTRERPQTETRLE